MVDNIFYVVCTIGLNDGIVRKDSISFHYDREEAIKALERTWFDSSKLICPQCGLKLTKHRDKSRPENEVSCCTFHEPYFRGILTLPFNSKLYAYASYNYHSYSRQKKRAISPGFYSNDKKCYIFDHDVHRLSELPFSKGPLRLVPKHVWVRYNHDRCMGGDMTDFTLYLTPNIYQIEKYLKRTTSDPYRAASYAKRPSIPLFTKITWNKDYYLDNNFESGWINWKDWNALKIQRWWKKKTVHFRRWKETIKKVNLEILFSPYIPGVEFKKYQKEKIKNSSL